MADILCPSCGKSNPDSLDACQFCQSPLSSGSRLEIGQKPTKKNTGELENILPDWLKDVRKQSRDLAEEDANQVASMPKVQKDEPPDLLAGLAFQSESDNDDQVPDWLSSISTAGQEKASTSAPSGEPEVDFFAQFSKSEPIPQSAPVEDGSAFTSPAQPTPEDHDELSDWLTQATAQQPAEFMSPDADVSQIDSGWGISPESSPAPEREPAAEQEDLSWLRNLEAASKQMDDAEASTPAQEGDWLSGMGTPAAPGTSSEEDLSWLNDLGGISAGEQLVQKSPQEPEDLGWLNSLGSVSAPEQPASQSFEPKDDLSWLNDLGDAAPPQQADPPSSPPQDDLSWLNAFSDTPASLPSESSDQAADDLSWLNQLGGTTEPAQRFDFEQEAPAGLPAIPPPFEQPASQDDFSWLNELQGSAEPLSTEPFTGISPEQNQPVNPDEQGDVSRVAPFTPRHTAPLSPAEETSMPDWLRSATEGPSMPVGAEALDQFREDFNIPSAPEQPFSWKSFVPEARDADEEATPAQPQPASVDPFTTAPETSSLSNQDVDSLFSLDMPDWLSHPDPASSESTRNETSVDAEDADALAPVDLPSWVQAMRPVEALISESAPGIEDQPTERDGPLMGFRGVIPAAPIGSSRRPRPVSLTLQASSEQQSSAAILEQIITSETSPRALVSAPSVVPQQMLRQALAVLVWLVLGVMVYARSQVMPVSASLPVEARDMMSQVTSIADNSQVLVVVDYEPALAGEMEAVSGPLLDQLALLRHARLSFVSTSPNGPALVERLMTHTNINKPSPEGLGYVRGEQYFNLGYLPGGESGVLAFVQSPQATIPSADAASLSGYAALILLTDHADSARVWVEQLHVLKQTDPALANQPLLVVSSAQAGPMLQPYVASRQVDGLISGLSDAVRYEFVNNSRPGIARSYWDTFGVGLMLAISSIVLGSLWSLLAVIRSRRTEAAEG